MTVALISCLDNPEYRAYGLLAERIPQPFLNLPAPLGLAAALAAGRAAFPDATKYCYAQPQFLSAFFSLDLLYAGALHQWLDQSGSDPLVFRRIVIPGPPDLVCVTAAQITELGEDAVATHELEIERWILQTDARRKTFVFGDSHVWNLYTDVQRIGMRGVVVEALNLPSGQELKISRHLGAFTMHRLAERGELTAQLFRDYGVRRGDRVVAVCGEIDIRNHIGRISAKVGIPRAPLIADLCTRFCRRLEFALEELQPVEVALSCPTPPLDFAQVGRDDVEHFGSIEDRIDSTRVMAQRLRYEAERRGWAIIDLSKAYEDSRGALRAELSDRFCHVEHSHKGPATDALARLIVSSRNLNA